MTKSNILLSAYDIQARKDRIAAAKERRDPDIAADNLRIKKMYIGTLINTVVKPTK